MPLYQRDLTARTAKDMQRYTKEQKQDYFQTLRDRWNEAKELAQSNEMQAAYTEARQVIGTDFSPYSFTFIKHQLNAQGLTGTPYIDCKTFKGWKESGYQVKKGEKSKLEGITWIGTERDTKEGKEGYRFPKVYHLFHREQVVEIA